MTLINLDDINFNQLHRLLFLYAMKQAHDRVISEHVVGDVIARVFEKMVVEGLTIRNLRPFLYTSVYNGVVDAHRRSRRLVPIGTIKAHWLGSSPPLEITTERRILHRKILSRVQRLPALQRHVVVLRYMEGLSLDETARLLGKRKSAIKAAAQRAMKTLRRLKNE
jgi:RNA polymerase sigma-70 factor, ECF subfamily